MGNRILSLCSLLVALFIGSSASAVTITFDELPLGTVVNGMVIGNVTFGFSSVDATIDGGPGVTAFIDLPNIEGDATGLLTLSFATPVLNVSYGFALNTFTPVNPGTVMELFDTGGGSLGLFSAAAADFGFGFVEGGNVGASATPIGSAVVAFDNFTNNRFAFDNLTFTIIPEPGTGLLVMTGLLGLAYCRRGRVRD